MTKQTKKRGPKPKPEHERRECSVGCKLTWQELCVLDSRRGRVPRGEWLRRAALGAPPSPIPPLNREAWAHLGKVAGGLSTLARAAAEGRVVHADQAQLDGLRAALDDVRRLLIGAGGGDDER